MAVCKKCGKNLKKTNSILSVESGSVAAQNEISKGDIIVAVDGKTVKSKDEIESALKDKTECKINISHKDQTRTISINEAKDFLKGIDFTDEDTCSSCGAKQKGSKVPLIIALIAIVVIIAVVVVLALPKDKTTTASIDIADNSADFTSESIGKDTIDRMADNDLTVDFKGNKVSITSSGSLTQVEKSNNIEALNKNLERTGQSYGFLDFEDSAPVFTTEKVGSDNYRKMYAKNNNFDVRKPSVSGYSFNNLTQDKLVDIGKTNKEILGTIYFDYGYANWHKNAVVKTQKTTLGKIDFNEIRYAETITALKNLLSEIPQAAFNTTVFYLDGHTDHTSPHDFNQTLSEARAECIKEILVKNFGINPKNIVTKGYSWDRLAVNTLEECAENRRVEVSVVFFN